MFWQTAGPYFATYPTFFFLLARRFSGVRILYLLSFVIVSLENKQIIITKIVQKIRRPQNIMSESSFVEIITSNSKSKLFAIIAVSRMTK